MNIVMDAYDIPPTIAEKLLTGEYVRKGSVIRHAVGANKGQIVKHLDPVDLSQSKADKGLIKKAALIAKNNKKATIIVGVVTGVICVSVVTYKKVKNVEGKVLKEFKKTFKEYIEAIRKGTLDVEIIDRMSESLEALKVDKNYHKYEIALTAEDLEILLHTIRDFTVKLAEDNNVEIEENYSHSNCSIIDFQHCLDIQRKVLAAA